MDSLFSIYLSNQENVNGNLMFGGYDLASYAKKGSSESDIYWVDQTENEAYWAVKNENVKLGDKMLIDY
jgi:hypothetical protein